MDVLGVKDGFDIIIGNPPYIDAKEQLKRGTKNKEKSYLKTSGIKLSIRNGIYILLLWKLVSGIFVKMMESLP